MKTYTGCVDHEIEITRHPKQCCRLFTMAGPCPERHAGDGRNHHVRTKRGPQRSDQRLGALLSHAGSTVSPMPATSTASSPA